MNVISPLFRPIPRAPAHPADAWHASRSQVGGLMRGVADARGNRDGIPGNEDKPAGTAPSFVQRQPLLARWSAFGSVGITKRDDEKKLDAFLADAEKAWGEPVTTLPDRDRLFRVEKAIALTRFQRRPSDVVDGFVHAGGSVDGHRIADREVFVQRWKPIGKPSGKVVVIAPGYLESGRNFYEQAQMLNRQGADVIILDPQWAGYTSGRPGMIDRGFGITRDVAAVAAYAQQIVDREYPGGEVILAGNSMGGGPGVVGAQTMNDNGLIHLDGPQMPKGLASTVESPYFATSHTLLNAVLTAMAHVPLVRMIPLKALGLPIISVDRAVNGKIALHATVENTKARFQAFTASTEDIARIRGLIASGHGPTGRVSIVQGSGDLLADPGATREVARDLGANLQLVDTASHVLEEDPRFQAELPHRI